MEQLVGVIPYLLGTWYSSVWTVSQPFVLKENMNEAITHAYS